MKTSSITTKKKTVDWSLWSVCSFLIWSISCQRWVCSQTYIHTYCTNICQISYFVCVVHVASLYAVRFICFGLFSIQSLLLIISFFELIFFICKITCFQEKYNKRYPQGSPTCFIVLPVIFSLSQLIIIFIHFWRIIPGLFILLNKFLFLSEIADTWYEDTAPTFFHSLCHSLFLWPWRIHT